MSEQMKVSETEVGLTKAAASLVLAAEALEKIGTARIGPMKPATPRRGLSRGEAADYIGVSQTLFDTMVKVGQMPKPIKAMSRVIWDIRALDEAFTDLATEQTADPWN